MKFEDFTEDQLIQFGNLLQDFNPKRENCEVTNIDGRYRDDGVHRIFFTFDNERTGRQGVSSEYIKFRTDGPADGRIVDFEVLE
jgi:hypothetical protein